MTKEELLKKAKEQLKKDAEQFAIDRIVGALKHVRSEEQDLESAQVILDSKLETEAEYLQSFEESE